MTDLMQQIINSGLDYANDLLEGGDEFYPFGIYVDNDKNVHPFEYEFDKKNMPSNGQISEWIESFCREEMAKKRILAYCIASNASVKLEETKPFIETVCFDITYPAETETPLYYVPFNSKNGKTKFGEIFAVKR